MTDADGLSRVLLVYLGTGVSVTLALFIFIVVGYWQSEEFKREVKNSPQDLRLALLALVVLWPTFFYYLYRSRRDRD
jgi:uncharacterized BrkB/YihY/UPF0761 family membrane protein